jgi:FG-GAP-like repeat/ASPIC and UnbV
MNVRRLLANPCAAAAYGAALAIAIWAATASPVLAQVGFVEVSSSAGLGATRGETWGASWADVTGDSYPDVFFSNHRQRATLYRNNRNGTFTEISATADASQTPGWTGGRADVDTHAVAFGDVDNDGDPDLYQSVEVSADMFHTNTVGVFTNRSSLAGVTALVHRATRQNLFFDYTGDGRLDLASVSLVKAGLSPQTQSGTFGAETPLACATTGGLWAHLADIDRRPGLELLCATRDGTYPKVNAFADGIASNVTGSYAQIESVMDAVTLDVNRDLRSDLFLVRAAERASDAFQFAANRFEAQFITAPNRTKSVSFKSTGVLTISVSTSAGAPENGDPAYIDIGSTRWSPSSLVFKLSNTDSRVWGIGSGSAGLNIGYLPATGEWKIVQGSAAYSASYVQVASTASITQLTYAGASAADRGQKPLLRLNTLNGLTTAANSGFDAVVRCPGAAAGDFDNDMDEDLYLACTSGTRNLPNRLYLNNGYGRFTEVPAAAGAAGRVGAAVAAGAGTSDSVTVVDYDRDGFLDLLVTNGLNMRPVHVGGPKQLFRNRGNANHWIELDLVGTTSNRDAVGAKVYITAGGVTQYREHNGGYHRWSQNSTRLHAGLAGNTSANVTVDWPDGTSSTYWGLQSRRLYRLRQAGGATVIPR